MSQMNSQTPTEPTLKCPRKNRDKSKPTRQPGRPHRRLDDDVLTARKNVLKKKLTLLMAKKTICEERFQSYEDEEKQRALHVSQQEAV